MVVLRILAVRKYVKCKPLVITWVYFGWYNWLIRLISRKLTSTEPIRLVYEKKCSALTSWWVTDQMVGPCQRRRWYCCCWLPRWCMLWIRSRNLQVSNQKSYQATILCSQCCACWWPSITFLVHMWESDDKGYGSRIYTGPTRVSLIWYHLKRINR